MALGVAGNGDAELVAVVVADMGDQLVGVAETSLCSLPLGGVLAVVVLLLPLPLPPPPPLPLLPFVVVVDDGTVQL